ncbi:hypothetical protein B0H66DRAFT_610864 [Apodospora peruviana]|uniref:Uncharacterized protein n=1 Tax=Apodospora peruviana TaxID=516989 RepID=A0AAE0MG67_9PEZI|nr:hypothetical protein B0H66DRAFT_610864 [Apodospora peruviana]
MCIKIIRHFACDVFGDHVCNYILRCSAPVQVLLRKDPDFEQACIKNHSEREEWYDDACPDCTGFCVLPPQNPPSRVVERDLGQQQLNNGSTSTEPFGLCETTLETVGSYTNYLCRFIFYLATSNIFANDDIEPLQDLMMAPPSGGRPTLRKLTHKFSVLLQEILCKSNPSHGAANEMDHAQFEDDDGGVHHEHSLHPTFYCDCFFNPQQHLRFLSNPATHIRTLLTVRMLQEMCQEDQSDPAARPVMEMLHNLQNAMTMAFGAMEKQWRKQPADLQTDVDMIFLPYTELQHRIGTLKNLMTDAMSRFRQDIRRLYLPDEAAELKRLQDRANLVKIAIYLMAADVGVSLSRARMALSCLLTMVVGYDADWASFDPSSPDRPNFHLRRLAYLANHNPRSVRYWADMVNWKLDSEDEHRKYERKWGQWCEIMSARAEVVLEIVRATSPDLARLDPMEACCPACCEDLVQQKATESELVAPSANKWCHANGAAHWYCRNCLVRNALAIPSHAKGYTPPAPHCPTCRVPFHSTE